MARKEKKLGRVYLVGAGPGRADLITVRGAKLLKQADCVIYDKLVNPALLRYVREDAEIIHTPKRVSEGSVSQGSINELLVEKAGEHDVLVRLKGGDPCMFGRGAEEAEILSGSSIEFEIVPGITAGVAACEYAGVMLTDRRYSSEAAFVTGREAEGKQSSGIDWPLLAKWRGSIIFYMGMGNLEKIAERLIDEGLSGDTAAAVIQNATLPNQRVVRSLLRDIAKQCKRAGIGAPAIVVIGKAAKDSGLEWFRRLPLFGKSIVVTRDATGNAEFAEKITERGGEALSFPTIKIKSLTDEDKFTGLLKRLWECEVVVFTSANGVRIFFDFLSRMGKDSRVFGNVEIAAVGLPTMRALMDYGLRADYMPAEFTTKALAQELINKANIKGKRVMLLRSAIASDELPRLLLEAGVQLDGAEVYTAVRHTGPVEMLEQRLREKSVHWLTFTSPSTVENFFEQIDTVLVKSAGVRIASIGPVTADAIRKIGLTVDAEAKEYTTDGLLKAIEQV